MKYWAAKKKATARAKTRRKAVAAIIARDGVGSHTLRLRKVCMSEYVPEVR